MLNRTDPNDGDSLLKAWKKANKVVEADGGACPCRLFGGKCQYGVDGNGNLRQCEIGLPPCNDHHTLWKHVGQITPVVFVAQPYPYDMTDEKRQQLDDYCVGNGLNYRISNNPSWHYPGEVLFIEIWLEDNWTPKQSGEVMKLYDAPKQTETDKKMQERDRCRIKTATYRLKKALEAEGETPRVKHLREVLARTISDSKYYGLEEAK